MYTTTTTKGIFCAIPALLPRYQD